VHIIRAAIVVAAVLGGYLGPGSEVYISQPARMIAALLLIWDIIRTFPRLHPIVPFTVVVFGLLSVHALFTDPISAYGEQKLISVLTAIMFTALIAGIISIPHGFTPFARWWIAVALYLSVATVFNDDSLRADVFGMNPIWVGRVIAVGFVLLVWLYWTKRLRLVWLVSLGFLLLFGIFATGSRGPLTAAVAGTAVIILASKLSAGKKIIALVTSALSALVLVQLPMFKESRIVALITGEITQGEVRERLWKESLEMVAEHPLGVGYGNWAHYSDFGISYPHNLFLEIFTEQGIIVGLIFVLVVAAILLSCLRASRSSPVALGVTAILVTEILHVSVSGDLKAPIFFFLLALAFLVGIGHSNTDEPIRASPNPALRNRTPITTRRSRRSFGKRVL